MKHFTVLMLALFICSFVTAGVEEFGYSNPSLPILGAGGNVSLQTVNNSIFWAGYPFVIDRWLQTIGGTMSGDIDMDNNSIWGVDTLQVHNLTGNSPIYTDSDFISTQDITAVNFYGNFDIVNGTVQDISIDRANITNLTITGDIFGGYIEKYTTGNFTGSLYTSKTNSSASASNSLFQVISDTRGTPQFLIQDGGPEQASFVVRSFMVVNQNNTLLNSSQNNICSDWGFTELDCNTSSTGADFGVTDDAQVIGRIYANGGLRSYTRTQSAHLVATDNITAIFEGDNGEYFFDDNIFCDYVSNNFVQVDGWINVVDEDSDLEGAWANIGTLVNSSCVELINNPSWTSAQTNLSWRVISDPELIFINGGFGEYYIGDSPRSAFEFNAGNGTGIYSLVLDDTSGRDGHEAFRIEQDLYGFSSVAQNIFMTSSVQLVDKELIMLSMVGDATNMNSSSGTFIDMSVIGQPLTNDSTIDGIHMPAGMNHLITVGVSDTIDIAYSNARNITNNITTLGLYSPIFTLDNDILYIGNSLNFTNIGITLSTPSSADIDAVYYYCNNTGGWEILPGVTSTTGGFISSGLISFPNPADRGKCNRQINGTAFSNTTNFSYIAIQRTRNFIVTTPVIDIATISGSTTSMFLKDTMLRLSPVNTAPQLCVGANLGAIYYDISEDDMCVCKSTGWKVMTDGSDCT